MCNFGREYCEEQVSEIIMNLDQWFRRCRLKTFLIYSYSSVGPHVWQNHLCNFGIWHYGEHSCEVILNLDQWFRRRHSLWMTHDGCTADED